MKKHNLRSDLFKFENKGMALDDDIKSLGNSSLEELIDFLSDDDAIIRTSAAINLMPFVDKVCDKLLLQLSKEKSLYTKISICQSLQNGNIRTAKKMTNYLGIIGNNQYKNIPKKVSLKKSYPLPRDIIARTLSKMKTNIFPTLIKVLESNDLIKIYEVIDAIGFMVFYNKELSNDNNLKYIIDTMDKYKNDELLTWKCLICLSSFNLEKSKNILKTFMKENRDDIFSKEAKRSFTILSNR